jgi:hypothetical protein
MHVKNIVAGLIGVGVGILLIPVLVIWGAVSIGLEAAAISPFVHHQASTDTSTTGDTSRLNSLLLSSQLEAANGFLCISHRDPSKFEVDFGADWTPVPHAISYTTRAEFLGPTGSYVSSGNQTHTWTKAGLHADVDRYTLNPDFSAADSFFIVVNATVPSAGGTKTYVARELTLPVESAMLGASPTCPSSAK